MTARYSSGPVLPALGKTKSRALRTITAHFLVILLTGLLSVSVVAEELKDEPAPVTTSDPAIRTNELALLLSPLSKDELLIEIEGWRLIVKTKAEEIAQAEIAVLCENRAINKAEELKGKTQAALKVLD